MKWVAICMKIQHFYCFMSPQSCSFCIALTGRMEPKPFPHPGFYTRTGKVQIPAHAPDQFHSDVSSQPSGSVPLNSSLCLGKKKVIMETKQTRKSVELNCIFVVFLAASATSSPATLGMKEHRDSMRDYQSSHSAMQFYNYREDGSNHKKPYTGMLFRAGFSPARFHSQSTLL